MPISSRRKAIAFFITFGVCLVAVTVTLNVSWIVTHWRSMVPLIIGIIFFAIIIAGLILNTIFLVREIQRNEKHDSFINAVTHELKTPIASMRLYLETLQTRTLEEPQKQEFYRVMLEDTDRLLGTVEQVLKAGKLGQKGELEHRIEVNVGDLVRECMQLARTRLHLNEEAIQLMEKNDEDHTVIGDPQELHTAVMNLIDNAIKYSSKEVSVSIKIYTHNDRVLVSVRDRGIGIPKLEVKQIFNRFYRVKSQFASEVKGTGLGLFIVRSIARRHGGDAFARSEGLGKGTTVILELPRMWSHVE